MEGRAPIQDFDAAYSNVDAIANAADYPARWTALASTARSRLAASGRLDADIAYGPAERQRYDLLLPAGEPSALVVFVHGGYWRAFDKSHWSHLASGALRHGCAVAIPSYTLCPQARIATIGEEIAAFLAHLAARVPGPIRLAGHSAGGQLAMRLAALGSPLAPHVRERLECVLSISGLHDLRPLLRTRLNETLRLDEGEAASESPIFRPPPADLRLVCAVGASELPEFRRQTRLLADVWQGLGARIDSFEVANRHHFDVVEELCDPASPLTRLLTGAREP